MKCIEPGTTPIRYIRLRKLKKREQVLVGYVVGEGGVRGNERYGNRWASGTRRRDLGSFEASDLLLKETDNWVRLALKLYFAWIFLQFTVNGMVLGRLFTYHGPTPWFGSLIYIVFIVWNLAGAIGTVLFYNALVQSDVRMNAVIETMAGRYSEKQGVWPKSLSALPLSIIRLIFIFCSITMFTSLAFWIILFVART